MNMRRKEKEINDFGYIETILKREKICRLALSSNDFPYLVPLSYGYADKTLYFHSANEGKKIELLKANPNVCFEIESNIGVVTDEIACKWGMQFETIIGNGTAEFIEEPKDKIAALNIIAKQYGAPSLPDVSNGIIKNILVFKISFYDIRGKISGK